MTTAALVSWTSPHAPCLVPGRGQSCDSGLGPEDQGWGARPTPGRGITVSSPASWSALCPHGGDTGRTWAFLALGSGQQHWVQQQLQATSSSSSTVPGGSGRGRGHRTPR